MNNGASIEDKNEDEETPFLLAARHGNIKYVMLKSSMLTYLT